MLPNLRFVGRRFVVLVSERTSHRSPVALPAAARRDYQTSEVTGTTKSAKMEKLVQHDAKKNTFSLSLKEGSDQAVLVYDWVDDNVIDFHHTEVPVSFRGQGIAKILAKTGMDFAVKENLKVILTCTYMAKYVNENPLPEYLKQLYDKGKL